MLAQVRQLSVPNSQVSLLLSFRPRQFGRGRLVFNGV